MSTTPISVYIFRNGDVHHAGVKILMKATIKTMAQFYDVINKEVGLVTGACRKVVTPEGHVISKLSDLKDGGKYVACAGEPLNKEKLPHALTKKPAAAAASSSSSSSSSEEVGEEEQEAAPHPAPKAEHKPIQKFGTMATKPKIIYVFRNGDLHDAGTKITLKATITTMDKLYQAINNEVKLVTGACRKVVTPENKEIKKLADFVDEGKYIALAGEPLNKEKMSKHIHEAKEAKE